MRWFAVLLLCFLLSSATAVAQEKALGLGFSTASSGLSGYAQASHGGFVQGLLGLTERSPLLVVDYCKESPFGELTGYVGGGALLQFGRSDLGLGVHVPVGVYYRAKNSPLIVNLDVAPGILATGSDTFPVMDMTVGLRFVL